MKRAQLCLKKPLSGASGRGETRTSSREVQPPVSDVGWKDSKAALEFAAGRYSTTGELLSEEHRGAGWEEVVIARLQLPELGAELLVLEGVRQIQ